VYVKVRGLGGAAPAGSGAIEADDPPPPPPHESSIKLIDRMERQLFLLFIVINNIRV